MVFLSGLKFSQSKFSFIGKRLYASTSQPASSKKTSGIKQLIAKYGYTSLATYLFIGGIDFAICFMLLHKVGEEEIFVKINEAKARLGFSAKTENEVRKEFELKRNGQQSEENDKPKDLAVSPLEKIKYYGNLLLDNSMFKEALIAYGIHKSLIFIRLPITAMITPPIYNYLLRVRPNWVLRPQVFNKTVINPMKPDLAHTKSKSVSWWRKIIG